MKTDKIFHSLFHYYPEALFELRGLAPETAQDYEAYKSVELKETSFRLDGVVLPKTPQQPILFVEVQFRREKDFYHRVFAEVFVPPPVLGVTAMENRGYLSLSAHRTEAASGFCFALSDKLY